MLLVTPSQITNYHSLYIAHTLDLLSLITAHDNNVRSVDHERRVAIITTHFTSYSSRPCCFQPARLVSLPFMNLLCPPTARCTARHR